MHELVAQFLAHDGYVETARAFAEEVASESAALHGRGESLKKYEVEEDLEAINRQSKFFFFFVCPVGSVSCLSVSLVLMQLLTCL